VRSQLSDPFDGGSIQRSIIKKQSLHPQLAMFKQISSCMSTHLFEINTMEAYVMSELNPNLNPQPLPPRVDLAETVEAISTGVLRALEARKLGQQLQEPSPSPWRGISSIRIICGGLLDLQKGVIPQVGGSELQE
jgi:hypothetical protein